MTKRSDITLRILFILMLIFFSFPAIAQEEGVPTYEDADEILNQAHVRGFFWGLPPSIIKEEEKGVFVEEGEDGTLFFVDTIRNMRSSIAYQFEDEKLYRVQIFSENNYPRPQKRIDDLLAIQRDLEKRFGEPAKEELKWLKDTDKKYPNQWGWAIYRGDLTVTLTWEDEESLVTAYAGAPKRFEPVLFVTYEDAKAKKIKEEQKVKDAIQIMP